MIDQSTREIITNQRELWEAQHFQRGISGREGTDLVNTPNPSALHLETMLDANSVIAEVGSANGRDARGLAANGHIVYCIDFSRVALTQLDGLAKQQGVADNLVLIEHDINEGLPFKNAGKLLDGFYARSALHVADEAMFSLGQQITRVSKPDAVILVEGKTGEDSKIRRSADLGFSLRADYDGHLRRVWDLDFIEKLCKNSNWRLETINNFEEEVEGHKSAFVRFVARVRG